MYSKHSLFETLTMFLGISMAIASESSAWAHQQNSLKLMNIMSHSRDILRRNPDLYMYCFNYYIPLINQLAEKYQNDVNTCLKASEEKRDQIEEDNLNQRNDLSSRATSSCQLLSKCSGIESAENAYECFIDIGLENSRSMNAINADASVYLADLRENLRLIDVVEFKCTNETKREYEKDSLKANDDFNSCILGHTEVPNPSIPPTTKAPVTYPPATDSSESVESESSSESESSEEDADVLHQAVISLPPQKNIIVTPNILH